MNPESFCYWLQGRAELVKAPPSAEEWECIKEHLSLVFKKLTSPGPGQSVPFISPTIPPVFYPAVPPVFYPKLPVGVRSSWPTLPKPGIIC